VAAEVFVDQMDALRSGHGGVRGARQARRLAGEGARSLIEVVETSFAKTAPTDEEMTRVRRDEETAAERDPGRSAGVRRHAFRIHRAGRLAPVFRRPRRHRQAPAPIEVSAAAERYFRRDNRTVGLFIPEDHPQRAEIAAPLSVEEMLRGYTPRAAVAAGESFRTDAREHRRAHAPVSFGDLKVALAAEENQGRNGQRRHEFSLWRRKVAARQGRSIRDADRGDAGARHGPAHAPADRRRDDAA
jgi:hypothetical protein